MQKHPSFGFRAGISVAVLASAAVLVLAAHGAPPSIDYPPRDQEVILYQQAAFGIIAGGTPPLSYQWLKNGLPIPRATNDQIVIQRTRFSDEGKYSVIVSNAEGRVTSAEPELKVKLPQAGDVDLSFNTGLGVNGSVLAMTLQPDGKVLIGGAFTSVQGAIRSRIARLNADGGLDFTFDPVTGANNDVESLALQADGKVIIAGTFSAVNGVSRSGLARLNVDGSLDIPFAPRIDDFPYVRCAALQADGKVLIAGSFSRVNGVNRRGIARLNPDGTLDNTFMADAAGGTYWYVNTIAVLPDGKIIVGGHFTMINGSSRNRVARLNADGSVDFSFNPNPGITNGYIRSVAVQADNKVILGGWFQTLSGPAGVVCLNANGSLDSSFGLILGDGSSSPNVSSVLVEAENRILIAGRFRTANGTEGNGIVRVDADGQVDSSLDLAIMSGSVETMKVEATGGILLGGKFLMSDGPWQHIVRVHPIGSRDQAFDPGTAGNGVSSAIRSLALRPDGKVMIAGYFTHVQGARRNHVARLNRDGGLDSGFTPEIDNPSWIDSLVIQADGKVLLGGSVRLLDDDAPRPIVRLATDGTVDTSFTSATLQGFYGDIVALQPDGKILVGASYHGLVRLNSDGTLDSSFHPATGSNSHIRAIAPQGDGKLLVGGWFTDVNGFQKSIARFNPDGTLDPTFAPGVGPNGAVYAIALQSDGNVIIGGGFTSVNGINRSLIARLRSDGSLDEDFVPPQLMAFGDHLILSLGIQQDGRIIIGGAFTLGRGTNRNDVARLNVDGSLDLSFDPGQGTSLMPGIGGSRIFSLAVQPDGKVIVGGSFGNVKNSGGWMISRLFTDTPSVMKSLNRTGSNVSITWYASPDRSYRLQYKDDLSTETWLDLPGDVQAEGHTASTTDASAGNRQRFYRVVRLP